MKIRYDNMEDFFPHICYSYLPKNKWKIFLYLKTNIYVHLNCFEKKSFHQETLK